MGDQITDKKEELEPSEEELTNSFNEIVNGESPQPAKEEQEEVQEEEEQEKKPSSESEEEEEQEQQEEEQEKEKPSSEVSDLKAKNTRLTQKKNKWKEKYNGVKTKYDKLVSGEMDDEFEDERERDLAIVEAQNELTYAKNRNEELSEQEVEDFYMVNTDAKESRGDIEQIMEQYGMDVDDAYKFHLSKTNPQKLYDQQKANQAKGGNGMLGSEGGAGGKKVKEASADDLEAQLTDSFNKGDTIL